VALERLNFTIDYIGIETVKVNMKHMKMGNEGIIEVHAKSKKFASYLADIDNYYRLDYSDDFVPDLYMKKVEQKGYREDRVVSYNHINNTAFRTSSIYPEKEKRYSTNSNSRDFFSSLFYLRYMDEQEAELNLDVASIPWICHIKRVEDEKIKTFSGKRRCRKFKINFEKIDKQKRERTDMLTNNLVREENTLYFWITDDDQRIPVKAEYQMAPFSVYWNLKEYEKE
jgi:hypothetical protein